MKLEAYSVREFWTRLLKCRAVCEKGCDHSWLGWQGSDNPHMTDIKIQRTIYSGLTLRAPTHTYSKTFLCFIYKYIKLEKHFLQFYFICVGIYLHVYMCTMCMQCLRRPEESIRTPEPGAGVTDGCELPCRCWGLNPNRLKSSQCP